MLSVALWTCFGAFLGFTLFFFVIRTLRRMTKPSSKPARPQPAFGMDELHAMRNRGEISAQEFERLQSAVLHRLGVDSESKLHGFQVESFGDEQTTRGDAPARE